MQSPVCQNLPSKEHESADVVRYAPFVADTRLLLSLAAFGLPWMRNRFCPLAYDNTLETGSV